ATDDAEAAFSLAATHGSSPPHTTNSCAAAPIAPMGKAGKIRKKERTRKWSDVLQNNPPKTGEIKSEEKKAATAKEENETTHLRTNITLTLRCKSDFAGHKVDADCPFQPFGGRGRHGSAEINCSRRQRRLNKQNGLN